MKVLLPLCLVSAALFVVNVQAADYIAHGDKVVKEMNKVEKNFPQDSAISTSDKLLNTKIREETSLGYFWDSYKTLALHTDNGVVTLAGTIKSDKDAQNLVDKIQKIEGVKSVTNNLQVEK